MAIATRRALLSRLFADQAISDAQAPMMVGARYASQPGLALLRPRPDYYASQTPTAGDCLLVIEVGDTSADFDRQIKMPRYARGEIAELRLVDLERAVVVVYQDPTGDSYQHVQVFRRGDSITLGTLQGPGVPVEAILG